MNNAVCLPVSLGEAIDKLTILDIKLQKIKDERRFDVKKEYDLLYSKLEQFVIQYSDLYQTMKRVNVLIWDMMDSLRDGNLSETEYLRICKECIEYNDIRFRVKNKINYASNSELREQKSYLINRIVIYIGNVEFSNYTNDSVVNADKITNIDEFIIPIKYFSFIYDQIVIVSDNVMLKNTFSYDPTILFETNIKIDQFEYKKQFIFKNDKYDKNKIYSVFGLNDDIISLVINL